MKNAFILTLALSFAALNTGCASNMTVYMPPQQQMAANEFYSVTLPQDTQTVHNKIQEVMKNFPWLQKSGSGTYSGQVADAAQYVDCGKLTTYTPLTTAGHGVLNYAAPKSNFMGESSADELTTSLAVTLHIDVAPVPGGSKVTVTADYTLNREHIERRSMFGIESRPPAKNTPISFDTLMPGSSADGIQCQAKLSLERSIINAISEK